MRPCFRFAKSPRQPVKKALSVRPRESTKACPHLLKATRRASPLPSPRVALASGGEGSGVGGLLGHQCSIEIYSQLPILRGAEGATPDRARAMNLCSTRLMAEKAPPTPDPSPPLARARRGRGAERPVVPLLRCVRALARKREPRAKHVGPSKTGPPRLSSRRRGSAEANGECCAVYGAGPLRSDFTRRYSSRVKQTTP